MSYSGACVGGPLDHKNLTANFEALVGAEIREVARSEAILAARSETLYRWTRLNGIGLWVADGLTTDDVLRKLVEAYLRV